MPEIFAVEETMNLSREQAADVLRQVADSLARHNELEFDRGGMRVRVEVPDQVELEMEVEISDDGGSLEIEIEW